MTKNDMVSVVLPTYNERDNILLIIEAIHRELMDVNHEILVVDDNSPDDTHGVVIAGGGPYVRPFLRTNNPSLARAIRFGLEHARGDRIIIMDSDFNHHPRYLPFMVQALDYYECVAGSRFLYGGQGMGRKRHLMSWGFNLFLRLLTDGRITDNLFGCLSLRRNVLERLNYDKIFWGFGDYCIRLLFYLQKEGVAILQIPMVHDSRLRGTGNSRIVRTFFDYTIAAILLIGREGRIRVR
jgi:dolichol-phosphate mannosyltransferase